MNVFALQGETLDSLCFRVLGQTAGVVERTLELNPGLAVTVPCYRTEHRLNCRM